MIPASTWIESASPFSISTRRSGTSLAHGASSTGLDELRRHPSVEAASLSSGLPFGVPSTCVVVHLTTGTDERRANGPAGGDDDRRGPLDVPNAGGEILRGRGFDDRDGPAAPRVVVLSEFTARQMFGAADVVGREMAVGQTRSPTATIVGVAADTDVGSIFADPRPLAYVPLTQHYQLITVVARASGSVTNAVGAMREAIRRADPDVAVDTIGTGRSVLAGPFQVLRGLGMTAVGLGAITLLLAMAGLYGIQSHIIANRTREIGVRMSLGATAGQIKRMVLVDGYRPVLDGLIFGLSIGLVGRAIARVSRAGRRHRRSVDAGGDADSVDLCRVLCPTCRPAGPRRSIPTTPQRIATPVVFCRSFPMKLTADTTLPERNARREPRLRSARR